MRQKVRIQNLKDFIALCHAHQAHLPQDLLYQEHQAHPAADQIFQQQIPEFDQILALPVRLQETVFAQMTASVTTQIYMQQLKN